MRPYRQVSYATAAMEPTEHAEPEIAETPAALEIGRLVCEKKFCAAARLYSETTGADLVESKLAIDRLAHRHGHAPIRGCASHFVLLVTGLGMGLWSLCELARRVVQL